MDLNKVTLIGNVTGDPHPKAPPLGKGQTVVSFTLATNFVWEEDRVKRESVEFHDVLAYGKLAEIISQYVKKGSKVYIEGRLQTRSWDGQDGNKRYTTEIVARDMQMLDSRESGRGEEWGGSEAAAPSAPDAPRDDDDLPF